MDIADKVVDFLEGDTDNPLVIKHTQDIPDYWLQAQADKRFASSQTKAKEWHEVCSVPVVVVEKWLREGFDIHKATAREIVKKLKSENLEAFLSTTKRV
jgi:hypothetical protein